MANEILILPDIHGRDFWRDAVSARDFSEIVFLGDYLDPYGRENIEPEDAFSNFQDIVTWSRSYGHNAVLLLGNHDLHYWRTPYGSLSKGSRFDFDMAAVVAHYFARNVHMFKLAHEAEVAGKKFLFTHAGVNADWLLRHADVVSEARAAALNDILPEHIMVLDEASYRRGGNQPTGSIIWADVNEMKESPLETDFYQIFGHSQQVQDPVITEHWACLDCRRPFIINGDGEIEDLTL